MKPFRLFLMGSSFRLPPEAQKIDRMLECFAQVYHEENPRKHDSSEAVYVLANAILMLNTSQHNPLVKPKDRISLVQFLSMVTHIDGCQLTRREIENLYESVSTTPFKIDWSKAASESSDEKEQLELRRIGFEKSIAAAVRRALLALKDGASSSAEWMVPRPFHDSADVLLAMFAVVYEAAQSTLFSCMEQRMKAEISLVGNCMEGIKFLLVLSITLRKWHERDHLLDLIARFCYLSKFPHDPQSKEAAHALQENRHLGEQWRADIVVFPDEVPLARLRPRFLVLIDHLRDEYLRHMNSMVLNDIQSRISGYIVNLKDRVLIASGEMNKLCANNAIRAYSVFIFGDAMFYASADGGRALKVHRVIQLALCTLVDCIDADGACVPLVAGWGWGVLRGVFHVP
jgi:hypothetical protein